MLTQDREAREDDEDRFYGHVATFVVIGLMAVLLIIPGSLPPMWVGAAFAGWGVLLAGHGVRVFRLQPA